MNLTPISTKVEKSEDIAAGYLVLEDYYLFKGESNLYLIDESKLLWFADKPSPDDIYVDFEIRDGEITAWTWNCYRVRLDYNGKIISCEITK